MEQTEATRTNILTRATYYEAYGRLQRALPPPLTDTQEDLDQRDNRAMAELASLVPVTSAEVKLAVLFVSASAHAEMVLGKETHDEDAAQKVRAQAASMMRQAYGGLSHLMRLQTLRGKREASTAATDAAAWTEHIALDYMAEARKRALKRKTGTAPDAPSSWPGLALPPHADLDGTGSPRGVLDGGAVSSPAMTFKATCDAPDTVPTPSSASHFETESGTSCNETPVRRVDLVDATAALPPIAPQSETDSRSSYNEAPVRRASALDNEAAPASTVSEHETEFRSACNETPVIRQPPNTAERNNHPTRREASAADGMPTQPLFERVGAPF